MRTLFVTEFITLDGVTEAPGGEPTHPHTGWVGPYFTDEIGDYKLAETREADSLLLGRITYESFAGAWPSRDGEFADKYNAMPKHVVSGTLTNPEWNNTTVVGTDVAAAVRELKAGDGGPIMVAGSGRLVQGLIKERLVDELRLLVFPVLLGSGAQLFPRDNPALTPLLLTHCHVFDNGVTARHFAPTSAADA